MATATKGKSATIERAAKEEVEVSVSAPSRREFLYYIWGASVVLLLGETTAGLIWFALPRFKEGEFGGIFRFPPDEVPDQDSAPLSQPAGRFWVSNSGDGFLALYAVCTHLGCLPKWVPLNDRFECPCHGSKFEINGTYIAGPAPRNMDRFRATLTFDNGDVETTDSEGNPIPLNGRQIVDISIDTGDLIRGEPHG